MQYNYIFLKVFKTGALLNKYCVIRYITFK
jgi:hypothetical protein